MAQSKVPQNDFRMSKKQRADNNIPREVRDDDGAEHGRIPSAAEYQSMWVQKYQMVRQTGATPQQAKEAVLSGLVEQQVLLFNQGSGSRLFNAFLYVAEVAWALAQYEVTKPGT